MRKFACLLTACSISACSGGTVSNSQDMAKAGDMAGGGGNDMAMNLSDMSMIFSCCGQPGDKGNSKGVGAYCDDQTNCPGPQAIFCASLGGDPNQHFCTIPCTPAGDGGTDPCGEMASCQCQGGQCGCYPDICAMRGTPDGCM
jgi:hypothetical protein